MRELSDILFPRICPVCGVILNGAEREICLDCLSSLPLTYFWLRADNPAAELFWGRVYFQRAASLFFYNDGSPYKHLIHNFKYKGRKETGVLLGRMLGKRLRESGLYTDIDFVAAVPLHPLKHWSRGYNQAGIIAEAVARELGVKVLKGALRRRSFTATQTSKNAQERWSNVSGVFRLARRRDVEKRHILLVDDVLTTGATLETCGHALLEAEGCKVSVATLAFVE